MVELLDNPGRYVWNVTNMYQQCVFGKFNLEGCVVCDVCMCISIKEYEHINFDFSILLAGFLLEKDMQEIIETI